MAAELVEHRTLRGENAPIRLVGRVGAVEDLERLLEIADVGKRAAVSAEQGGVAGVLEGCLLQHRDGLRSLAAAAQRLRVGDCRRGIIRFFAIAAGQPFGFGPPFGFGFWAGGGLRGDGRGGRQ